jgi:hypothetical protein
MTTDRDALVRQLEDAFANRALLYWEIYRAFAAEMGADRAAETLAAAIERRGEAAGKALFGRIETPTPRTVADAFLAVSPDGGRLFPHDRIDEPDGGVRIHVRRCPLQDAWRKAGLSDDEQALMCRIAGRFDNGCFGAAGIGFAASTWTPGAAGCCRLHLKPLPERDKSGR